jgi:hypothetical protein
VTVTIGNARALFARGIQRLRVAPVVRRYGAAEVLTVSSFFVGWFIGTHGNTFNHSPDWLNVLVVGATGVGCLALRSLLRGRQH